MFSLRRLRRAQTTVETMLVISVLVVAMVAAGYGLANESWGITAGFKKMADGAGKVYANPDAPNL